MNPDLIIQTVTLCVLLIGTVIAWGQLRLIRKQIKAQHDWNRRVTSLTYSFSADPHIREIRNKLDTHLKIYSGKTREISIEEIEAVKKEGYEQVMTDIQFILGRLESMCVAIKNNIVDERTCKDMLRGLVIEYFRFFRQYIEDKRVLRDNQKLYACLQFYSEEWSNTKIQERDSTDARI